MFGARTSWSLTSPTSYSFMITYLLHPLLTSLWSLTSPTSYSFMITSPTSYSLMITYFNHLLLLHNHFNHFLLLHGHLLHPLLTPSWSFTSPTSYSFMITYFNHFLFLHNHFTHFLLLHDHLLHPLLTPSPSWMSRLNHSSVYWVSQSSYDSRFVCNWSLLLIIVSAVLWILFFVGQLYHLPEMSNLFQSFPQIFYSSFLIFSVLLWVFNLQISYESINGWELLLIIINQ